MLLDKDVLVRSVRASLQDGDTKQVLSWVEDPATQLISDKDARQTVAELKRLWRTRANNVEITGVPLQGVHHLLDRFSELRPQHQVQQFAAQGLQFQGTVFLLASTEEYLGAVLVPSKPGDNARL